MLSQKDCILTHLLDCGSLDLQMLEDINYDLDEMLDDMIENGDLSLNNLFALVFEKGKKDLKEAYNAYMADLESEFVQNPDDKVLAGVVMEFSAFNIDDDFSYFTNCLDTHVSLRYLGTYREYLPTEIEEIENNMGFAFSDVA